MIYSRQLHEAAHDNNEAEEKPSSGSGSRCAATTITRMNFKVHAGEENEEWRETQAEVASSTSCVPTVSLPDTRHRTETT